MLAPVGRGVPNQETGAELHLSPATARTHVGRVLAELGARDPVCVPTGRHGDTSTR